VNSVIRCALAACAISLAAIDASAQKPAATTVESLGEQKVPWTVAIRPSSQSVAIGSCQLVYIDLRDETGKDIPRRPDGMRVSIADFDWTATGAQPGAAVGVYSGANAWSACACQSAVAGSSITIAATYPARSSSERSRLPGLAFRSTVDYPISRALGASEPKGCDETPAPATVVAVGTPLAPSATRGAAVALPAGGRAAPGEIVPPAASRPAASVAPGPPPPSGIATDAPNAPAGPPVSGIYIDGTPAEAVITWFAPYAGNTPGPTGYIVERKLESNPACCKVQSPTITERKWVDPLMLSGSWKYTVISVYADGRRGTSWNRFTYPEPGVPANVKAEQVGRDSVLLTWDKVTGAKYYAVTRPSGGAPLRADSTHLTVGGIPNGPGLWRVSSVYTPSSPTAPVRTGPSSDVSVTLVPRRYRLVAEALRVGAETVDQPLSGDGKFDEVYITAVGERIDRRNGQRIDVTLPVVSAVHGDISFWPPPQRVKAGTASGNGGIHQGDVVTPIWSAPTAAAPMGAPNFVLWEGELIDGRQDLVLHPMVIELDEPDYAMARDIPPSYAICNGIPCNWGRYFTGPAGGGFNAPEVKAAIAAPQISVVEGKKMFLTGSSYFVHLEHMDRDRPIGLEVGSDAPCCVGLSGMWRDKMVTFSREKIEAALASGQNKFEVRFWDHSNLPPAQPAAVNYLNGDYTLVIRMERAP
jgi:hypothetical protein